MPVVLNREQVRSEFEKRCEAGDDEDETSTISISALDLLEIFNAATEGDGFVEANISGAYQARSFTEDTALAWSDIDNLMDDVEREFGNTKAISPTIPMSAVAENITKNDLYKRITERQEGNEFPCVQPNELLDDDRKEEALLILALLADIEKTRAHQYVLAEYSKTCGPDGEQRTKQMSEGDITTSSLPDSQWIYANYFSTLQRFLLLECQKEKRFCHKWEEDHFLPLVSPRSIGDGESREQATKLSSQVTEKDIPVMDEALWKAWAKIETRLVALEADTCEPFVRFVVTEYFGILAKSLHETYTRTVDVPPLPYAIDETEPERLHFQRAFEAASEQQKLVAEAFVDAEYKTFRSELDSETVKYLPQKPSDAFASARYYKKLVELVAFGNAPSTPKQRKVCEPVHITPKKKARRTNTMTVEDFYKVSEITTSCKVGSNVHFRGHVLSVDDDVRNIEITNVRSGLVEASNVSNIIIADASGIIRLALWRDQT